MLVLQVTTDGEPPVTKEIKARVVAHASEIIEASYGSYFNWDQHWHGLPAEVFEVLDPNEQVALWQSAKVSSHLEDALREKYPLVDRVRRCLWYYGCQDGWNLLASFYMKVVSFDFASPNFHVTVDYPWAWQGYGTGVFSKKWLDGGLAFILHYNGEPVATLGFSVSHFGLLIQQAQFHRPKGNRWAYSLHPEAKLLEVMVQKMAAHFDGCPLWIVDGTSQAEYIRRLHIAADPLSLPLSVKEKIRASYDINFREWTRTPETCCPGVWSQTGARLHHRLSKDGS